MSLVMTVEERQAFLARVHVAVVAVAGEDVARRWPSRSGTTTDPAARSA
jgi:hypothetical protein